MSGKHRFQRWFDNFAQKSMILGLPPSQFEELVAFKSETTAADLTIRAKRLHCAQQRCVTIARDGAALFVVRGRSGEEVEAAPVESLR